MSKDQTSSESSHDLRLETALNTQAIKQMERSYSDLSLALGELTKTVQLLQHTIAAAKPWTILAQHVATAAITTAILFLMKGHL